MLRPLRSLCRLAWLMVRDTGWILADLLRGDTQSAGGRARLLAISVQNDLLLVIAAVQKWLPFWRLPRHGVDRILIVKLDRLGDMVTTTPVFDLLHQLYPGARLDIVGHPTALALLEGDERIGERIPYRSSLYHPLPLLPPVRALSVVFKLLWRRYPVVVYLRGSFPFLLLGLTSRLAATKFVVAEPVITRYRKALEALFGPLPHPRARLHIDDGARRFAHELLSAEDGASGPRVVIHAAASAATKIWPAERFAELADQLVEKYNAQVHFLGSPDEKTGLERIARLARQRHAVHCSLKIPEVVAVIGAADLFIGNDSGLSHIAAAVDTRLVILWGPANLSMARPEAPPGDCIILYHEVACRNACPEFKCVNSHAFECLTRTQVADVLEAASQLVSPVPAEGRRLPLQLAVAAN